MYSGQDEGGGPDHHSRGRLALCVDWLLATTISVPTYGQGGYCVFLRLQHELISEHDGSFYAWQMSKIDVTQVRSDS